MIYIATFEVTPWQPIITREFESVSLEDATTEAMTYAEDYVLTLLGIEDQD